MDESDLDRLLWRMRDQSRVDIGEDLAEGVVSRLQKQGNNLPVGFFVMASFAMVLVSASISFVVGVVHEHRQTENQPPPLRIVGANELVASR